MCSVKFRKEVNTNQTELHQFSSGGSRLFLSGVCGAEEWVSLFLIKKKMLTWQRYICLSHTDVLQLLEHTSKLYVSLSAALPHTEAAYMPLSLRVTLLLRGRIIYMFIILIIILSRYSHHSSAYTCPQQRSNQPEQLNSPV